MNREQSRSLRLMAFCLFFICLLLIPAGALAVSVRLEPLSLHPGESGTTNLTLDSIPQGLSGYRIGLKLTSPQIAEIVNVTFPGWAGLNEGIGIPGSNITLGAVPLGGGLANNNGPALLATLTVKGLKSGVTGVTFGELYLEDGQGSQINPQVETSQITVSTTAGQQATTVATTSATYATGGGGGSGSGSTTGTSTGTTKVTTAPTTVLPTTSVTGTQLSSGNQSATPSIQAEQSPAATTSQAPLATETGSLPPATKARGTPFLSVAGIAGLMAAVAVIGTFLKKR